MRTYRVTIWAGEEPEDVEGQLIHTPFNRRAAAILSFRQLFGTEPSEVFEYRNWSMAADYVHSVNLDQINWVPDFPFEQFKDEQGIYTGPHRQITWPQQEAA